MVTFQAKTSVGKETLASIPLFQTNKSPSPTPVRLTSNDSTPNTLFLPTSILKATQSIHRTPILSTSKLQPRIVKTTNIPIKPSSTILSVWTTTTLSPMAEKLKQFKEGKTLLQLIAQCKPLRSVSVHFTSLYFTLVHFGCVKNT